MNTEKLSAYSVTILVTYPSHDKHEHCVVAAHSMEPVFKTVEEHYRGKCEQFTGARWTGGGIKSSDSVLKFQIEGISRLGELLDARNPVPKEKDIGLTPSNEILLRDICWAVSYKRGQTLDGMVSEIRTLLRHWGQHIEGDPIRL